MATEYQIKLLQECATQAAHHQDLADECQDAIAAMPSAPPQHVNGGISADMVIFGLMALIGMFAFVSWAVFQIEQLLVRLKLKRPGPTFWERKGIKPPPDVK